MEEEAIDSGKIGNEHLYDLLTSKEVSWQAIIYDLMNSGQLDPWNIDLAVLAQRYLEKIRELEEANFFVSSKVLLAASLLLRIKSEILLNEYIKSIDDILFGKKEEKKVYERIEIDENDLPVLYPKTPMPRMRKVSLQELMSALGNAINTENRRIRKEIIARTAEREAEIVLPKASKVKLRDRIRRIYSRFLVMFKNKNERVSYSDIIGLDRDERIAAFLPVLHLDHQQKIWLEQENHLDEIWLWLYSHYKKEKGGVQARELIEEKREELVEEAGFENPLAGIFESNLE
ncbi:MAG: segregation/condensation protein A [Nanoarchaeota archaeon]|nr:segregation/condensation protein A [Nanoarchaeota archaeon]